MLVVLGNCVVILFVVFQLYSGILNSPVKKKQEMSEETEAALRWDELIADKNKKQEWLFVPMYPKRAQLEQRIHAKEVHENTLREQERRKRMQEREAIKDERAKELALRRQRIISGSEIREPRFLILSWGDHGEKLQRLNDIHPSQFSKVGVVTILNLVNAFFAHKQGHTYFRFGITSDYITESRSSSWSKVHWL